MKSVHEIRRPRTLLAIAAVGAALGASACGGNNHDSINAAPLPAEVSSNTVAENPPMNPPAAIAKYAADGSRQLIITSGHYLDQVCDGPDLLDITSSGAAGGSGISRSPNHPACADGQLTPSDFQLPTK